MTFNPASRLLVSHRSERPRANRPWAWNWPSRSGRKSYPWIRWPYIRHMDIGTAKPSRPSAIECAHHLIDIIDPTRNTACAQYIEAAHRCVKDMKRPREKKFYLSADTPLYFKGLLRGIFQGPPPIGHSAGIFQQETQQQGPLGYIGSCRRSIDLCRSIASQRHAGD